MRELAEKIITTITVLSIVIAIVGAIIGFFNEPLKSTCTYVAVVGVITFTVGFILMFIMFNRADTTKEETQSEDNK